MTTLQERVEEATATLEADTAKMHQVVHGDSSTTVTTEGGPVKSLAKSIADMEAEYAANAVIAEGQQHLDDAYNWANRAEDNQYTDGDARTGYSAFHWAQKAQASADLLPVNKLDATTDPTITDDSSGGYSAGSTWLNISTHEVFRCIDASVGAAVWVTTSLTIDELGALASQDIVSLALMANSAKPYDVAFIAGYAADGSEEDVEAQEYGWVVVPRAMTVEDISAYAETAPTGAAMQFDVKKNGSTIFSTAPEIDDGSNADDGNHLISTTSVSAGDRLTFEITQVGSTVAGSGVAFSVKGRLA